MARLWGVAESDRDDLTQEVLQFVVRRVNEFEHQHPGAIRGCLRSILANHIKAYFRERAACPCQNPRDDLTDLKSVLSPMLDREHDEHVACRMMQVVECVSAPETWTAFRRQTLEGQRPRDEA